MAGDVCLNIPVVFQYYKVNEAIDHPRLQPCKGPVSVMAFTAKKPPRYGKLGTDPSDEVENLVGCLQAIEKMKGTKN